MDKADLHIHSTASDGHLTPNEIVTMAAERNLSVISLTDHDTISGVAIAQKQAKALDVTVIPGIEITTSFHERECHLLAYDFNSDDKDFRLMLRHHCKARIQRGRRIIRQLQKKGLDLDLDEVKAEANGSRLGRPHIAAVLVDKGYVRSEREAFQRFLSDTRLGTIENNYYSLDRAVDVVKNAGGVVVLAHPGRLYTHKELNDFVEAGIDGVEVVHPSHNDTIQGGLETFAMKHDLLITGGSDFHGKRNPHESLLGIVAIQVEYAQKVRQLASQRKEILV